MGIKGLLPALGNIVEHTNLHKYKGKTVGIDIYGWLHRGAYSCCSELARGIKTEKYINFCMDRIQLLLNMNIKPVVVFDGPAIPLKIKECSKRSILRTENLNKAFTCLENGDDSNAYNYFKRSIRVSSSMCYELMKALKARGIEYIVSPYEADGQLGYLSRQGLVDAVISEDSDCIPFGCKKVLLKLDSDGSVQEISRVNLAGSIELPMHNWTDDMFIYMCVLSGCDYCPSIRGVGIKTAHRIVDTCRDIPTILDYLTSPRSKYAKDIPDDFTNQFMKAVIAFKHYRVYDPVKKMMTMLNPVDEITVSCGFEDMDFLGTYHDPVLMRQIAEGTLHPITLQPYDNGSDDDDDDMSDNEGNANEAPGNQSDASTVIDNDEPNNSPTSNQPFHRRLDNQDHAFRKQIFNEVGILRPTIEPLTNHIMVSSTLTTLQRQLLLQGKRLDDFSSTTSRIQSFLMNNTNTESRSSYDSSSYTPVPPHESNDNGNRVHSRPIIRLKKRNYQEYESQSVHQNFDLDETSSTSHDEVTIIEDHSSKRIKYSQGLHLPHSTSTIAYNFDSIPKMK